MNMIEERSRSGWEAVQNKYRLFIEKAFFVSDTTLGLSDEWQEMADVCIEQRKAHEIFVLHMIICGKRNVFCLEKNQLDTKNETFGEGQVGG